MLTLFISPVPRPHLFFCLSVCLLICLFAFCIICFHVYSAKCKPKSKNQREGGGGPGNDENKGTFLCHIGGRGVLSLSEGVKIHEKLCENCL